MSSGFACDPRVGGALRAAPAGSTSGLPIRRRRSRSGIGRDGLRPTSRLVYAEEEPWARAAATLAAIAARAGLQLYVSSASLAEVHRADSRPSCRADRQAEHAAKPHAMGKAKIRAVDARRARAKRMAPAGISPLTRRRERARTRAPSLAGAARPPAGSCTASLETPPALPSSSPPYRSGWRSTSSRIASRACAASKSSSRAAGPSPIYPLAFARLPVPRAKSLSFAAARRERPVAYCLAARGVGREPVKPLPRAIAAFSPALPGCRTAKEARGDVRSFPLSALQRPWSTALLSASGLTALVAGGFAAAGAAADARRGGPARAM